MSKCECEKCEFLFKYKRFGNARYAFYCHHPNQLSIIDYYKEKRILSMPGFLGFAEKGFPKKQTSKWCPKEEKI